ncbi:hypothetical protein Tco_0702672 [Tanacetum coccineum]|uniref:Uncharacterized protein n=1 Tax=Tanacetum coccineum TaxID=301880 RepID=A0ABQ4XXJ2_9ASTR
MNQTISNQSLCLVSPCFVLTNFQRVLSPNLTTVIEFENFSQDIYGQVKIQTILNLKKNNRKTKIPRLQTAEDLEGDDLLLHDAEMEVMNMILLSIPNEIYNSVDACTSAKDMWKQLNV